MASAGFILSILILIYVPISATFKKSKQNIIAKEKVLQNLTNNCNARYDLPYKVQEIKSLNLPTEDDKEKVNYAFVSKDSLGCLETGYFMVEGNSTLEVPFLLSSCEKGKYKIQLILKDLLGNFKTKTLQPSKLNYWNIYTMDISEDKTQCIPYKVLIRSYAKNCTIVIKHIYVRLNLKGNAIEDNQPSFTRKKREAAYSEELQDSDTSEVDIADSSPIYETKRALCNNPQLTSTSIAPNEDADIESRIYSRPDSTYIKPFTQSEQTTISDDFRPITTTTLTTTIPPTTTPAATKATESISEIIETATEPVMSTLRTKTTTVHATVEPTICIKKLDLPNLRKNYEISLRYHVRTSPKGTIRSTTPTSITIRSPADVINAKPRTNNIFYKILTASTSTIPVTIKLNPELSTDDVGRKSGNQNNIYKILAGITTSTTPLSVITNKEPFKERHDSKPVKQTAVHKTITEMPRLTAPVLVTFAHESSSPEANDPQLEFHNVHSILSSIPRFTTPIPLTSSEEIDPKPGNQNVVTKMSAAEEPNPKIHTYMVKPNETSTIILFSIVNGTKTTVPGPKVDPDFLFNKTMFILKNNLKPIIETGPPSIIRSMLFALIIASAIVLLIVVFAFVLLLTIRRGNKSNECT